MAFLRNLLASILGVFIAFGLMLLFVIIIATVAGTNEEDIIIVKDNSVLDLRLDKPMADYGGKYTFEDFDYSYEDYTGLYSILNAIAYAKEDNHIKGISIENNFLMAGVAQTKALRDALADFKSSGKFVYAYGDMYSQKDYYLTSVADSIFLNPVGELEFKGLASEILFYKELQDKTGVEMKVIRHGKYKSAVEPFLNNEMSDANRQQITALLQSVWSTITNDIAESRNISVAELNTIADSLGGRTPSLAVQNHLIDKTYYLDQYEALLRKASNTKDEDQINYVDIYEYASYSAKKAKIKKSTDNQIAVVFAQGEIMYGEGNNNVIGQDVIINALREARSNDKVKGIVLRVDSPGGSALASDIIWREVEITKQSKPVYVSMGNLAASGGYYISCGAEKIYAEPNTITGSIGVFGMLPNFKGLADKWGINAEQVQTNKQATGYSVFEEPSEDFIKVTTEGIEAIYETFVSKVANGRGMTFEEVDAIAQGRVWSGNDALQNGLVDTIGGLDATIEGLATDKGIDNYNVVTYPNYTNSIEDILSQFGLASAKTAIEQEVGTENLELLKKVKQLQQQKGIQARLPFEIDIR